MPYLAAYSISSSRFMPHSRTGATTSRSGARAAVVTSNRTWSLPLPVQPCAMAVAPSRRATSTIIAAISGRPSAVASGYSFSYTAPACREGHTKSWRKGARPSATYAAAEPIFYARAWCLLLPKIDVERDHVPAEIFQPPDRHRRVEAARVGEHELLLSRPAGAGPSRRDRRWACAARR